MEPLYKPQGVEQRWQQIWEEEGLYAADPDAPGEPFVVMHPPPNISGSLTIGHCLQLSLEDALVRYHRMRGLQHALPARLRPRRPLDLGVDRAAAGEGGQDPARARPRRLRRLRPGVARALRRHDHEPVPAARRVARLPADALHDGRGLLPRRHPLVRPPLRARPGSTAPTGSSTGARTTRRRSPTSRSSTRTRTTRSRTSATRSPTAPAT